MIRAYSATYIRYENEEQKRQLPLVIIEIQPKGHTDTQLLLIKKEGLHKAFLIQSIIEITGYRRYIPKDTQQFPFGVGGISQLSTKYAHGMLEGISATSGISFNTLAKAFGEGLLQLNATD